LVSGNPAATADDGVRWAAKLVKELDIRSLSAYGIQPEHIATLVEKATKASSLKANPIALTTEELAEVLQAAM
jgi:alcohol dehydrogenase class IV